jgi:MoaA/NifB/PqqE/SkfB family radical SAM enzyme
MLGNVRAFLDSFREADAPRGPSRAHWVFDKYHSHDAWLYWYLTDRCNLRCPYCINALEVARAGERKPAPVDIPRVLRCLRRTGRVVKVRFTGGGEPLTAPDIVELCAQLAREHFIGFNTNLCFDNVRELVRRVPADRIVNINAAAHIKEMEREGLIDVFVDNYLRCKRSGIHINASAVAYPPLAGEVGHWRDFFGRRGILLHYDFFRGYHDGRHYPESYTPEEIGIFDVNKEWMDRYYSYRGVCNAGRNAAVVFQDGEIRPCFFVTRRLGNICDEFHFDDRMTMCPVNYCPSPLKLYDEYLYRKALLENGTITGRLAPLVRHFIDRISGRCASGVGGAKGN